jgi:predicted dinucleotide-binding enzyme
MSHSFTIGIFGAGKVGTALARLGIAAGNSVLVSGSPRHTHTQMLLDVVAPGAVEADSAEVMVRASDLVIIAVPFAKSDEIDYGLFTGTIVVDAMNYWPAVDGVVADIERAELGNSEFIAMRNPRGRWVKSLNHLGYQELAEAAAEGTRGRLAIGLAGDDGDAKAVVSAWLDDIGFDPVDVGALADGRRLETGGAIFGRSLSRGEFALSLGLVES